MSIIITAIVAVVIAIILAVVVFQFLFEVLVKAIEITFIFTLVGLVIVAIAQTIWGLMVLIYDVTAIACGGLWKAAKWMVGIKPPARPRSAYVPAYRA